MTIFTVTLNPTLDRTLHFRGLRVGELNRATSSRVDLSGKGVNVSVALRAFGVESVITGFCAGLFGRILAEGLAAAGYACDFVEVAGETRSNITVIDDATGVTTKLNEPGPAVTDADLAAFVARLAGRVVAGDLGVLSGSLPAGAPDDTYHRLICALVARGVTVVLDTSGEALRLGCRARPHLVKPNVVEAGEIVGEAVTEGGSLADLPRALQRIRALGPRRVLVSLDSRGAAYADGEGVWVATPPAIREVSAIGAGDALLTGALWAGLQGLGPEETLRWGVAAGTAAAMGPGSAMPDLDDIRRTYADVRVQRIV